MSKHISLQEKYKTEIIKSLSEELGVKNPMALPKLTKIVVNMGTGEKLRTKDTREKLIQDFSLITGQKPKIQEARISVAGFGLRAGMPVGLTATLRGDRMYNFLEKLTSVVLPRLRDFRGIPGKSFDKNGNYTLGLSEHTVFPEIDLAKVDRPHGLEMTMVVKNADKESGKLLLSMLGMPFEKKEN